MSRGECKYFIGIDISKESFDASCIDGDGKKTFHISTSIDRVGFQELSKWLTSLSCPKDATFVGRESKYIFRKITRTGIIFSFYISIRTG